MRSVYLFYNLVLTRLTCWGSRKLVSTFSPVTGSRSVLSCTRGLVWLLASQMAVMLWTEKLPSTQTGSRDRIYLELDEGDGKVRDVVTREVEDGELGEVTHLVREPEGESVQTNVRIYIPMKLNTRKLTGRDYVDNSQSRWEFQHSRVEARVITDQTKAPLHKTQTHPESLFPCTENIFIWRHEPISGGRSCDGKCSQVCHDVTLASDRRLY